MSILVVARAAQHPGEQRWREAARELILDWGRRWAAGREATVGRDWHPSIRVTKNTGGEFVAGRYTKAGSLDAKLAAVEAVDWFSVEVSGTVGSGYGTAAISASLKVREVAPEVSLVLRDAAFPSVHPISHEMSDAAFEILAGMASAIAPCGTHAWWNNERVSDTGGPYEHGGRLGLGPKELYTGTWVPGYDWMVAITGPALEKMGGIDEVLANAPAETRIPDNADDVVVCRLGVDPMEISEDDYRAWRTYLAPVLPPHVGTTRRRTKPLTLLDEDWNLDRAYWDSLDQ